MQRITFDLDATEYHRLKVKTAQDGLSLADVLRAAVVDYNAGKWRPKPAKSKGKSGAYLTKV